MQTVIRWKVEDADDRPDAVVVAMTLVPHDGFSGGGMTLFFSKPVNPYVAPLLVPGAVFVTPFALADPDPAA